MGLLVLRTWSTRTRRPPGRSTRRISPTACPLSNKPVVAGDLVYVTTTAGMVHAVHAATGEHVWAQRLPDPATSAPVVAQETLLVNVGERDRHGRGAAVVALDAATGERRWDDPYGGLWGDAAVDDDGRVLVDTGSSKVRVIDAATGVTAWRADLRSGHSGGPPS